MQNLELVNWILSCPGLAKTELLRSNLSSGGTNTSTFDFSSPNCVDWGPMIKIKI